MEIKKLLVLTTLLLISLSTNAQLRHPARDSQGRHEIPRGFVVITSDGSGDVYYTQRDYDRMVRLGSNYQVIRIDPTKLSRGVDKEVTAEYLLKLDTLVNLARNVGMKSVMKMTVYGMKNFSWYNFWKKKYELQEQHLERWQILWDRYAEDDFVVGYDLLNEPRKMELDVTYAKLTSDYLVPYYEGLIDEAAKYNADKLFYCQSIFVNKGEQEENMQYSPIDVPIKRKNVVFCPHTYQNKVEDVAPTMDMFDSNSEKMDAPMFVGEWGFPTLESTDTVLVKQFNYIKLYMETANEFDRLGCGSVKAWFTGNRKMLSGLDIFGEKYTWSIFQDANAVGSNERKYIMDIIARPYPQTIAGDIYAFNFNYPKRTLSLDIKPDNSKGASRIYISADRFYPDGFTVVCGESFKISYDPLKNVGLEVLSNDDNIDPTNFIWDKDKQQLIVLRWAVDGEMLHLEVHPGIY